MRHLRRGRARAARPRPQPPHPPRRRDRGDRRHRHRARPAAGRRLRPSREALHRRPRHAGGRAGARRAVQRRAGVCPGRGRRGGGGTQGRAFVLREAPDPRHAHSQRHRLCRRGGRGGELRWVPRALPAAIPRGEGLPSGQGDYL